MPQATTATPADLVKLDKAAQIYSDARIALDTVVQELNAGLEAVKRQGIGELKKAVARAANAHDQLKQLIEANPDLFTKPKTQTMHGLRVGYMQGRQTVAVPDEKVTIELIESAMPEKASVLIETKKEIRLSALTTLKDDELITIGCARKDGVDEPFIKPVDGEVEKFVGKLVAAALKGD